MKTTVSENLGFEIEKFDLIIYDVQSPDEFKKIIYQIPSTCQFWVMKNAKMLKQFNLSLGYSSDQISARGKFLSTISQIVFLTYWGIF